MAEADGWAMRREVMDEAGGIKIGFEILMGSVFAGMRRRMQRRLRVLVYCWLRRAGGGQERL
jgi:hypothetical protein